MVLVCRLKPSLLIKALHAYQSNSLHGRDDVFCLVQLTPLTLQGVKPHEQQWIRRLHPSSFHQNWTEPLNGSVSRLVFLSLHKVTGYFTHTHTHTAVPSIDLLLLLLLSESLVLPSWAIVDAILLTSPVFALAGCPAGLGRCRGGSSALLEKSWTFALADLQFEKEIASESKTTPIWQNLWRYNLFNAINNLNAWFKNVTPNKALRDSFKQCSALWICYD